MSEKDNMMFTIQKTVLQIRKVGRETVEVSTENLKGSKLTEQAISPFADLW